MYQTLFHSLIKNPKNMRFEGEDNDEKILYVFRRSFITNLDWMFVSLLIAVTPFAVAKIFTFSGYILDDIFSVRVIVISLAFWYLFSIGFIFQNFINWFFNLYIITNKRVVDIDFVGMLYKNISEAPITSIEDVTSKVKGTLRVIFNYGHVFVQTAGAQREFQFEDVAKPAVVRDIISDIITKFNGRHK